MVIENKSCLHIAKEDLEGKLLVFMAAIVSFQFLVHPIYSWMQDNKEEVVFSTSN